MSFLFVLVLATGIAAVLGRRHGSWPDHARRGLAGAMAFAGIAHLTRPDHFVQHLPDWVPARDALVAVTGLVEIAFGVALLWPRHTRRLAGQLLAAYLVAVFPANVYVAVADVEVDGQPGGASSWIRLPLQVLFIAWALWSTRTVAAAPAGAADIRHPVPIAR